MVNYIDFMSSETLVLVILGIAALGSIASMVFGIVQVGEIKKYQKENREIKEGILELLKKE